MPVYEFECRDCMLTYNKEIDKLVKNLNKKYAEKLAKKNTNFKYIELLNPKNDKTIFSVGKEGNKGIRRFRYKLDEKKFLYLELIDFKFSELFFEGDSIEDISCPCDKNCKNIERIFSPFKAIFEKRGGQNDRAPKPGDPLQWHKDYKIMKDEEQASNWVGQDHLNQYFGNSQHDGSYGTESEQDMPLYEFECIPCRQAILDSIVTIEKKPTKKTIETTIKKYESINSIILVDLYNEKEIARAGKIGDEDVDVDLYIDDGKIMVSLL